VSRIIGHSVELGMAWACRGMSLKTVVRFMQYLSLLLVLRPKVNYCLSGNVSHLCICGSVWMFDTGIIRHSVELE